MTRQSALDLIGQTKILAVLRGIPMERTLDVARALYLGGVRAIEYTFDHDGSRCVEQTTAQVRLVTAEFGDSLLVGCGTVLSVQEAEAAYAAGARILVSPNVNENVIHRTKELGAASMPGAMTPTEILRAFDAGADRVKLFPANFLGPDYIRAVRGPLRHIPMTAMGGINLHNIEAFLDAGVSAFGVGGELASAGMVASRDWAGITGNAQRFVRAIAAWQARQNKQ